MDAAKSANAIADRHSRDPRYRRSAATALWLKAEALTRTNHIAEARIALTQAANLEVDAESLRSSTVT
ncbi:MAG: hypothetical protein WDM89_10885 [Rhizomicrobium sp.]